jgi:outer membrane immunogenic protein
MRKILLSAVAATALLSGAAVAADIPVKGPVYKAVPAYNWTGWYGGINGGYGIDPNYLVTQPLQASFFLPLEPKGGFFGFQVGYNWHYTPRWLYGIEADFQFANIKDFLAYNYTVPDVEGTASLSIRHFGSIRGRYGYVMDRTLFFVTGGVAFANFRVNLVADHDGGTDGVINARKWEVGYVVGAGIEHAFANSWILKVEYQFMDFSISITDNTVGTTLSGSPDLHLFKIGLNRKFSGLLQP